MADRPASVTWPTRLLQLAGVAGPPLVLALAGTLHPAELTTTSAHHWRTLHLVLLPVFPLLALGPWILSRGRPVLRAVTAALGYVYAVFYSALDVLAGIGTGTLVENGQSTAAEGLFAVGNQLSFVGVAAYLLAVVLVGADLLRRYGRPAAPGTVLTVGSAVSFLNSHIYWPRGVLTMAGLAVGATLLLIVGTRAGSLDRRPHPHSDASVRRDHPEHEQEPRTAEPRQDLP